MNSLSCIIINGNPFLKHDPLFSTFHFTLNILAPGKIKQAFSINFHTLVEFKVVELSVSKSLCNWGQDTNAKALE